MITLLGGADATEISAGIYEVNTEMTDGVIVYLAYDQGDESSLDLYALAQKGGLWYSTTSIDASSGVAINVYRFTSPGSYCLPISLPSNSDKAMIVVTYTGGSTPGDSTLYLTADNKYSA